MKNCAFYSLLLLILVSCSSKQEKTIQPEDFPTTKGRAYTTPDDSSQNLDELSKRYPIGNEFKVAQTWIIAGTKIQKQFKTLAPKQLPNFMNVWYNVSKRYGETQCDAECDSIYNFVFSHYNPSCSNGKQFITLPVSITVYVYNQTEYKSMPYNIFIHTYKQLQYSYEYIPHLKTSQKVLYPVADVTDLLYDYMHKNDEQRKSVDQYINIEENYKGLHIGDYPIIQGIFLFANGTAVLLSESRDYNGLVFISKDTKEFSVEAWFYEKFFDEELEDEEFEDDDL